MTAAIFLTRFLETNDLKKTLELCTASVFGILEKSYNSVLAGKKSDRWELDITGNQDELCTPAKNFTAVKL